MKVNFILILWLSLLLTSACNSSPDDQGTAQTNAINSLSLYLDLKDALYAGDMELVRKQGLALLRVVKKERIYDINMLENLEHLSSSANLDDQRNYFIEVSRYFKELAEQGKLGDKTIYLEYCPMVNQNQGAYWLSEDTTIANPYFGNKMPTCGSVIETFNTK